MSTTLTTQMDKADATALTQRIRTAVDGLGDMLLEAHDNKAWKALGYVTWEAYVEAEFDMSRQHSYRLLDQGRVVKAIEDATGILSPSGDISEAAARDIKPDLQAVTGEIRARIEAGEDPNMAASGAIAAKRAEKQTAIAEKAVKGAAKKKSKAEKDAKQSEHDRQRDESRDKLPQAVKQQQAAREAATEARKGKVIDADEGLSEVDRIAELKEAVRVLEAENTALKSENALYGDMKRQWEASGYEAVIADKDETIRVLETRLYSESQDKAAWARSSKYWMAEAIKLGWSNGNLGTGEYWARTTGKPYVMPPEIKTDLNGLQKRHGVFAVQRLIAGFLRTVKA